MVEPSEGRQQELLIASVENQLRKSVQDEQMSFSFDPTIRITFWSAVVGGTVSSLSLYGTNQAQVQRALTVPTLRKSQIAIWLNFPTKFILANLCCLIGVVSFAFYAGCDPQKSGLITARDQVLPLFVMDVLGDVPGIPGIFVAALFCGVLSSLSSGLNSISAALMQDIIRPFLLPNISDGTALKIARIVVVFVGLVVLGLSYLASFMGSVLQAALSVDGAIGGCILGVFTLGMVFPQANTYGALVGLLCGVSILLWLVIGARVVKPPIRRPPLPVLTSGCNITILGDINSTATLTATTVAAAHNATSSSDVLSSLYSLSHLYYALTAVIIICVVGVTVSYITGGCKR